MKTCPPLDSSAIARPRREELYQRCGNLDISRNIDDGETEEAVNVVATLAQLPAFSA